MTKKGLGGMISLPLGLIGFFILVLILITLIPIQEDITTYENISEILDWDSRNYTQLYKTETNNTLVDVVYRFVDFIGYSSFEVVKGGVSFGAHNPDIVNAKVLIYLVLIALLAPLVLVIIKIGALLIIFTKDLILTVVERREIMKLRREKYG